MGPDGRYTLETPENVEVQFELAGPGSRFCAMAIDLLLISLILFVLVIVVIIISPEPSLADLGPKGEGIEGWFTWINALFVIVLSCILFGYHAFFELIMRGQTPDKRALKIRVIRDDGTPVTPLDVAIRNIMRVVDFLPAFCGLGGLISFWNRMSKRL